MQITILSLYSLSGKTSHRQKYRSPDIGCKNDRVALQFDRHLGNAVVEVPVKFESDWKSLNPNLVASRLCEIFWKTSDQEYSMRGASVGDSAREGILLPHLCHFLHTFVIHYFKVADSYSPYVYFGMKIIICCQITLIIACRAHGIAFFSVDPRNIICLYIISRKTSNFSILFQSITCVVEQKCYPPVSCFKGTYNGRFTIYVYMKQAATELK